MGKAIEQLKSGLIVGHSGLGLRGGVAGSVKQQVHDGDTINVRAIGNFGVRFLGVDAPEISFMLPNSSNFTGLSNPKWDTFLAAPFAAPFQPPLNPGLLAYLQTKVGPGAAMDHYQHAAAAEDALEAEFLNDLNALGQNPDNFQFFLAFAHEVMDRYGRLLGFINRDQPDPSAPAPRPKSYNERLLEAGNVSPYFIWPNIDPYRKKASLTQAVIKPFQAKTEADAAPTLRAARDSAKNARSLHLGIFDAQNALRLQPFEVRFLAQQRPPNRWVIDLSKNDDVLIQPQNYHTIKNVEDRLFIPEEFVALFVEAGWKKQP